MRIAVPGTRMVGQALAGRPGARGAETVLPLWLRLLRTLNTSIFNIKVVR